MQKKLAQIGRTVRNLSRHPSELPARVTHMGKILLCDDEESLCRSLGRILRAAGHEVVAMDGIARLRPPATEERFDLILTDIRMPEVSGFEILAAARMHAPGTPVIAMSGSAEIPDAVRAMHAGARDFLIKPFEVRTLEEAVAAVLKPTPRRASRRPTRSAGATARARGCWAAIRRCCPRCRLLAQVADTRCTVLITGESGTGKELAARSLHAGSARAQRSRSCRSTAPPSPPTWSSPSCSVTPRARSPAPPTRALGRFAQADGGTIFLDEIGEMELGVQAKLLRLIQDGELYPVGEETPTQIDVRDPGGHQPQPRARGGGRALPRRSVLAPQRHPGRAAVAARARRPTSCRLAEHFLARANERNKRARGRLRLRGAGALLEALSLAGEHPRAGERRRAAGDRARHAARSASPTCRRAIRTPRDADAQATTPVVGLPEDGTDLRAMLEAVEERMIGEALERTAATRTAPPSSWA